MNLLLIVALSVIVATIFIYLCCCKERHNFWNWGIPQPSEWPYLGIIGNKLVRWLHVSDGVTNLYNFNKDAKYIGFHSFSRPVVLIRDVDLVKTVLVKDFDHFADHQIFAEGTEDSLISRNLSVLNGEKWREVRNLLTPSFTSSKMKMMFELIVNCAEKFVDTFVEKFADSESIDVKEAFSKYTNDVIATCAFGIEIDSLKDPTNEFYVYGREATNSEGFAQMRQIIKLLFVSNFPKLSKLLSIKLVSSKITDFFVKVIETTIKERDVRGITRPDMLQQLMNARGKTSESLNLDTIEITAQAFVFFLAGFETTSAQMSLMAHEIAANPRVQERLQAEIDAVADGKVTYDVVAGMPYLDAVFQETLRLHPQLAMLSRHCSKPYELPPALPSAKPYLLEKGAEIMIPVAGIHRDPAIHENPREFNPERYLGKKITIGQVKNLGFSLGPRMCIGNRFAILETKVLFYHLLRKVTLVPCSKTCLPFKYSIKKFNPIPDQGFWLKFRKRK